LSDSTRTTSGEHQLFIAHTPGDTLA